MGNVSDNRSNLLAKNWMQVGPNIYKNLITEELIDCHELLVHSDQQLTFNNNMLMKRASLSHPNVFKLIYFCPNQAGTLCSTAKYKIKIYLEHQQSTLADLFSKQKIMQSQSTSNAKHAQCICCSLANGIAYLSDRYGYFELQDSMVWITGDYGLKTGSKMVPKVWIHSDLKCNQPQGISNEEKMCRQLTQMLKTISENNYCQHAFDLTHLSLINKLNQLVQAVYDIHNQSMPLLPRKRIQTEYSTKQQNVSAYPYSGKIIQASDNVGGFNFNKREGKQMMKQASERTLQQRTRKDNQSVLNRSGSKVFGKVNFSYNHNSATPKPNKEQYHSNHQASISSKQRTNQQTESPMQRIQHLVSSNRAGKSDMNTTHSVVSRFNPNFRPQESDLIISEEQTDSKLKQLMQTQRNPSDSTKITTQEPFNIKNQNKKAESIRQNSKGIQNADNSQGRIKQSIVTNKPENSKLVSKGRQYNLKMEHNLEISYENSSRVSIKSIDFKNADKVNNFQIVSQYRISVGPKALLDEIQLQNSEEYLASESQANYRQKSVFTHSNLNSEKQRVLSSSFEKNKFFLSGHQAQSGKNGKKLSQQLGTEYAKYFNKFNDVALTESKLQHSNAPQSERHHFYNENSSEENFKHRHLTSSNGLKDFKYQTIREQAHIKHTDETGGMLEHDLRLQQQIQSMYSQASEEQRKRAKIMAKINNTQQVLRENRKKLQRLQLEKDLEIQKSIIKKQMESLLISNLMVDQSHRIKEKVEHKKATFAQLKAEASKILEDLNF